jgi:acyl-coenzyme A thioesterase PaaI-like protein
MEKGTAGPTRCGTSRRRPSFRILPFVPRPVATTGARLLALWRTLHPLPGGRWLFARLFARAVPYSASTGPTVVVLEPGHAEVRIPDRRANRQHLGSVHAIALMNVAEMTSGLAMMAALPPQVRGIVREMKMEYFKKARGTITAVSRVTVPDVTADVDFDVTADCLDPSGAVVARATVRWRLGLTPTRTS